MRQLCTLCSPGPEGRVVCAMGYCDGCGTYAILSLSGGDYQQFAGYKLATDTPWPRAGQPHPGKPGKRGQV